MLLDVSHITKSFSDVTVIRDGTFHLEDREKAAIAGNNGAGKTTIFRMIAGEQAPDSGAVFLRKFATVGYLKQESDLLSDRTVYDEVLSVREDVFALESAMRDTEKAISLSSPQEREALYRSYDRLTAEFERKNGYAAKSEVLGILKGLGFPESRFSVKVSSLSGGEKTRVSLSKLLLEKPDLLLLDEPTNHLDLNSVSWLENYLSSYENGVLLVSHDRYFLDRVATKIIDLAHGETHTYRGNYTEFVRKKQAQLEAEEKAYENYRRMVEHEKKVIETLKSYNREKSIKRAESREKRLAHVEEVEKPAAKQNAVALSFSMENLSGNDVLSAAHLSKSFGEKALFRDVSFELKRGEHVSLIGDNGTGKTTLLRALIGETSFDEGSVTFGANVTIGYYDQQHESLTMTKTVFDEFHDEYPDMDNTSVRSLLALFLFTGDDVFKLVSELSGGEKSRLALAKLMVSGANLLILDEPTNHLDMDGKEALEKAVREYPGTVIAVSHDRYFVNAVSTRIFELYGNTLLSYQGNYDYYLEKRDAFHTSANGELTTQDRTEKSVSEKDRYLKNKERNAEERKREARLKALETKITELESSISEIERAENDPENATNASLLLELSDKKETFENELLSVYTEWEAMIDKNG